MTTANLFMQRSALSHEFTTALQQRATAVPSGTTRTKADSFAFALALFQGVIYGAIGGSAVSALMIALVLGLRQVISG